MSRFDLQKWAENKIAEMSSDIKAYIDGGLDYETAVDVVFDASIVTMSYKMQALEAVGNYRHTHKFVLDVVTSKNWCTTCQKFENT